MKPEKQLNLKKISHAIILSAHQSALQLTMLED